MQNTPNDTNDPPFSEQTSQPASQQPFQLPYPQSEQDPPMTPTTYPQQDQATPLPESPQPDPYQEIPPVSYTLTARYQPIEPLPMEKKSRKGWKIVGIVVAVLIVLGMIVGMQQGTSILGSNSGKQQAQATTASQGTSGQSGQTGQSAPTTGAFAQFSDGTYTVGKDIQPGTYRIRTASPNCYYARLDGFGGTLNDIITNNNTDNPAIVTISATDKGFQSTHCGTWTQNLSAITTSQTSFPDGMYIVSTDIQPGTYKSSGQIDCYYARLSGFSNSTGDIIANDNTNTAAIITISASDKGFQSTNCGTWTKE